MTASGCGRPRVRCDQATAGLMTELHRQLRRGATLSQALREARAGVGTDPVRAATAWSFVALGAS